MANLTQYSPQEVMNLLYGSSYTTQYSVQEVANLQYGSSYRTQYSFQTILCRNLGVADNAQTEQEALFNTLSSELFLTGNPLQYSLQELLNLAYQANVPIGYVIGTYSSVGLGTWGLTLLTAQA